MSNYKKADHRLVQPRPEHYKKRTGPDGEENDVLCGPYSLEQRDKFFDVHISMYMTRHPNAKRAQAKQVTFSKWRNLVFATIGDEYVPATGMKDVVKVFKPKKA